MRPGRFFFEPGILEKTLCEKVIGIAAMNRQPQCPIPFLDQTRVAQSPFRADSDFQFLIVLGKTPAQIPKNDPFSKGINLSQPWEAKGILSDLAANSNDR